MIGDRFGGFDRRFCLSLDGGSGFNFGFGTRCYGWAIEMEEMAAEVAD